jgi:hypothetical protein
MMGRDLDGFSEERTRRRQGARYCLDEAVRRLTGSTEILAELKIEPSRRPSASLDQEATPSGSASDESGLTPAKTTHASAAPRL